MCTTLPTKHGISLNQICRVKLTNDFKTKLLKMEYLIYFVYFKLYIDS